MTTAIDTVPAVALPSFGDEDLEQLDAEALLDLIVRDQDRVPRNVIDAAAHLGDAMVAALEARLASWEETEELGTWWLGLHAVMILGVIPTQNAGSLLVDFMRRMSLAADDALQDWLAGDWSAFFANKPASVIASLRALCRDETLDWYIRANALDPVVAAAERQGPDALDEALTWVAQMAADEQVDWDLRLPCGNMLIDFPREPYRHLLDELAKRQQGFGVYFSSAEVARAYAAHRDKPDWRTRDDPWKFYRPEFIARRQERWAEEVAKGDKGVGDKGNVDDSADEYALPYMRETPKTGRNDPCPCGSGKKYKKCCLGMRNE